MVNKQTPRLQILKTAIMLVDYGIVQYIKFIESPMPTVPLPMRTQMQYPIVWCGAFGIFPICSKYTLPFVPYMEVS